MSTDNEAEPRGLSGFWHRRGSMVIGAIGLAAWFALLWFMFGDVL